TLMSESLRNDGRIWVPKKIEDAKAIQEGRKKGRDIAEEDRDYYLERRYPAFGNLVPRDVASRAAKERCDAGFGVNRTGEAVFLDFASAIERYGKVEANVHHIENPPKEKIRELGMKVVSAKYGNLFDMYENITGDNPYEHPMMIYPAVHYTMGGLWVDYNLMSTIPNMYVLGEANFSDHGANRLGASALMQGLADGYFIIPYTIGNYLANIGWDDRIPADHPAFREAMENVNGRIEKLLSIRGKKTVDQLHRELGLVMWDYCGMSRTEEGLKKAKVRIQELRSEFWENVNV